MTILDGKALSNKIKEEIKFEVEELQKEKGITPGLAVVLVGADPASAAYVNMKSKACKQAGIYSIVHEMPETISQDKILEILAMMNKNPNIDGILVQLPLPKHVDTTAILEAIAPEKDVDGFHAYNTGRMTLGLDSFTPATPYGVMRLLEEYNIDPKGKNVCVIGASNIVGKPMGTLLLNANATVTTCHIHTKDLKEHTKNADIICVGVGKVNLITEDMVKDGAVVIDIGINRLDTGKLVGDVDFENVSKKCAYISPVPGGVGPMTIAMLLVNTIKAARLREERERKLND
ncbi:MULTISPECIES: bifunctional methylenetetrahydrofolate dehydrogenase/methenyltetrahydrofolate cyclohydrolase FolD [Malaciobacter]|jgi:methylenetetrahydrofolate dehydrogenase (NADP+)/methenyltetrahydrofolate cyclohydrolase|uniref:Bifunctional protein FolD n=2 Tax=Malaciobacter TaxID=2321114 RepID=A0AB36ZYJ8_9BACT|nr:MULTISPECIES: bifunctional methylenetetrahydrofolate dehydrogenase/methenyltetrahydrofolate cyclohydrolase FolD [Malaciobacter]PHO09027.1 bifunctional methylenetetrahydrofolate dehydrogenase/methenyltetrahydrofolate cyclohydrolase FolD [Malaciobacter canalis]PPK60656.1 methylenetetrahydrofolate dehydrogenase (NADP+)/methenyltetrahydrofolate cyclohydrolase [Malaciobacter marinus]QEE32324.1 bifunctional 5,10-methylene-tetrahydrofolate dehydrogenase / 5,10-methylene-tetrahydrofolate cyclohydrola